MHTNKQKSLFLNDPALESALYYDSARTRVGQSKRKFLVVMFCYWLSTYIFNQSAWTNQVQNHSLVCAYWLFCAHWAAENLESV